MRRKIKIGRERSPLQE